MHYIILKYLGLTKLDWQRNPFLDLALLDETKQFLLPFLQIFQFTFKLKNRVTLRTCQLFNFWTVILPFGKITLKNCPIIPLWSWMIFLFNQTLQKRPPKRTFFAWSTTTCAITTLNSVSSYITCSTIIYSPRYCWRRISSWPIPTWAITLSGKKTHSFLCCSLYYYHRAALFNVLF